MKNKVCLQLNLFLALQNRHNIWLSDNFLEMFNHTMIVDLGITYLPSDYPIENKPL